MNIKDLVIDFFIGFLIAMIIVFSINTYKEAILLDRLDNIESEHRKALSRIVWLENAVFTNQLVDRIQMLENPDKHKENE